MGACNYELIVIDYDGWLVSGIQGCYIQYMTGKHNVVDFHVLFLSSYQVSGVWCYHGFSRHTALESSCTQASSLMHVGGLEQMKFLHVASSYYYTSC